VKIQSHPPLPRTQQLEFRPQSQEQNPQPGDSFQPRPDPAPPAPKTSWFHRTTGAVSGAVALASAGAFLLTPLGHGIGAEGLIYPAVGLLAGAGGGLIAGALAAGHFHSDENKTSLFHRSTAVVSGAVLGGLAGAILMTPAGNGKGAEGLIYPLMGLAGGSLVGSIGLGLAAGRFPDR